MAVYKQLTKETEERLMVQAKELYENGYIVDEIAAFLGQPVTRIRYWIGLINQVAKMESLIHS
jgi:isochorismate synthase EntC